MVRVGWAAPVAYFFLAIAHSGVRIGRQTYILDMASGIRRTDYVAVSNSVIATRMCNMQGSMRSPGTPRFRSRH